MASLRQQYLGEYNVWKSARQRCNNPNDKDYRHYGGRGIQFKFSSFADFIDHIGPRPEGYELDRIDNDKSYEPGNVRWVDRSTNMSNTRHAKLVSYQGKTQGLKAWGRELNISYWTLVQRYNNGWSPERILTS